MYCAKLFVTSIRGRCSHLLKSERFSNCSSYAVKQRSAASNFTNKLPVSFVNARQYPVVPKKSHYEIFQANGHNKESGREYAIACGMPFVSRENHRARPIDPCFSRTLISNTPQKTTEQTRKEVMVEDPFYAPTYNIPERPVSFTEGASYSLVILAGLGVAAIAGYAVLKELVFQPKEYMIFSKALKRIQDDSQVRVRIGSPVTGYGQESRNRASRQQIPHKIYKDEDGLEHIRVDFHVRGPHGSGKAFADMFKDKADKQWKYNFLVVHLLHPYKSQLLLESYLPEPPPATL